MPSQVRACFVNIIIFERCEVYCTPPPPPCKYSRHRYAVDAIPYVHTVVSSRGEKEDEEEGDDFQNVRTGLIAVRRVVVERRRVRAQPAALAQVDAFFGG